MRKTSLLALLALGAARTALATPSLTIYNQNFAVVRDTVPLDLQAGVNKVQVADTTAFLEPDSVVLRDPSGKTSLRILEQNYRSDTATPEQMLKRFEGQTIDFQVQHGDKTEIVRGKIIRSGYVYIPGVTYYRSPNEVSPLPPLIEVEGKLQFQLPGIPLFPSLADDSILRPTLDWQLETSAPAKLDAELSYVSGRFNWEADYNVIAPESGDTLNLTGWVTLSNSSGKSFENARIKLMAGDVSKLQSQDSRLMESYSRAANAITSPSPIAQKTFDEYHLYTLERPANLRDGETKQVELVRAPAVASKRIYVYDGVKIDTNRYNGYSSDSIRSEREYGTQSNPKVWVMREFANTKANGLGVALPKGRVRFYRRNSDGQIEFTGENTLDHTPQGESVRAYTGDAFDVVGSRKRTLYKMDESRNAFADESFEIRLRNRKTEPVEIRVVEHLYRGVNWEITQKTNAFVKTGAQNIEFRVQVQPAEEKVITYTVHYTW